MRIVRFDSVGGASGDMILGAWAAIGADLEPVAAAINAMLPEKIEFVCDDAASHGLRGRRARVRVAGRETARPEERFWPDAARTPPAHVHETLERSGHSRAHAPHCHATPAPHAHRGLREIAALIEAAPIADRPRQLALAVFDKLATAEAEIHGTPRESALFHEVGACDAIADIVGACLALEQLRIDAVAVGPLPCGVGVIACAHGVMPNPAPATLLLLNGMATMATDEPFELVTPTGAALLATWAERLPCAPVPARVVRSGFGFGHRALNNRPNILRATLLDSDVAATEDTAPSALRVLETNLDDCNPQWIGDLIGRLLDAGARDAWSSAVTMKKGRPGFVLSVLAEPERASALEELIFQATTTFGIRRYDVTRTALDRRFETVSTPWGDVRVKIGSRHGGEVARAPEFEDCARLARAAGIAPRQVAEAAMRQGECRHTAGGHSDSCLLSPVSCLLSPDS